MHLTLDWCFWITWWKTQFVVCNGLLGCLRRNWKSLGNYGIIYNLLSKMTFRLITLVSMSYVDIGVGYNMSFCYQKGLLCLVLLGWLSFFVLTGWGHLFSLIGVKVLVWYLFCYRTSISHLHVVLGYHHLITIVFVILLSGIHMC